MATVYKIQVVSHWIDLPEKEIKKRIQKVLKKNSEKNEITVNVIRK